MSMITRFCFSICVKNHAIHVLVQVVSIDMKKSGAVVSSVAEMAVIPAGSENQHLCTNRELRIKQSCGRNLLF